VPQNLFTCRVAEEYDVGSSEMYEPELLAATADFLAATAKGGRALEFGIGTGRVALPLSERGIEVCGIDISADMLAQLRRKPGADTIVTTLGDFAVADVPGEFSLVYLVYNALGNLLEQHEQVEVFRNAARHLQPAGRFILGFDTLDTATQHGVSHHYVVSADRIGQFESPFRYAWPAELDLMAELAGLRFCERWADWDRAPFTSESRKHVSVWERP